MSIEALQVRHSHFWPLDVVLLTVITLGLKFATVTSSMSATGSPILVTELPQQFPGTILQGMP